jgi:hypothetical protein
LFAIPRLLIKRHGVRVAVWLHSIHIRSNMIWPDETAVTSSGRPSLHVARSMGLHLAESLSCATVNALRFPKAASN